MIGRGLLANPALAIEYKEKKHLSAEDMKEKLFAAHKIVLSGYEKRLQGGEDQLLNKMKTFWEYLEPQIGHKAWKAIHKSTIQCGNRTYMINTPHFYLQYIIVQFFIAYSKCHIL